MKTPFHKFNKREREENGNTWDCGEHLRSCVFFFLEMHLRLVDMQVRNVKVEVWEESHKEKKDKGEESERWFHEREG